MLPRLKLCGNHCEPCFYRQRCDAILKDGLREAHVQLFGVLQDLIRAGSYVETLKDGVSAFDSALCVEGISAVNGGAIEKLQQLEALSQGMMISMSQVKDAITEAKKRIHYTLSNAQDQTTFALESPTKCRRMNNNFEYGAYSPYQHPPQSKQEAAREPDVTSQYPMIKTDKGDIVPSHALALAIFGKVDVLIQVVREEGFNLPVCEVLCPSLRIPMVKGDKDKINVLGEVVSKDCFCVPVLPVRTLGPDSAVARRVRILRGPADGWIVEGKLAYYLDDKVVSTMIDPIWQGGIDPFWSCGQKSPNICFCTRWLYQHPDGRRAFTVLNGGDWNVEMNGGLSAIGLQDLQAVKDKTQAIIADVVMKQHRYVMIDDQVVSIERTNPYGYETTSECDDQ